jgi:hypothetical protein
MAANARHDSTGARCFRQTHRLAADDGRRRRAVALVAACGIAACCLAAGTTATTGTAAAATLHVATTGSDRSAGSQARPLRTIGKALSRVTPGDTILVRAGLYRERLDLTAAPSGTRAAPVTLAAFGDGEVIIDASTAVRGWTRVAGNVWKVTVPGFVPGAVIVAEVPLREVSHGQSSGVPSVGRAGVTDGSGAWFYDPATKLLVADMATALPGGDPNTADIVVTSDSRRQPAITAWNRSYHVLRGLTVRGAGGTGILLYGSNTVIETCTVKFNFSTGILFDGASGIAEADNAVLDSVVHHNFLSNWPRGNNNHLGGEPWGGGLMFHLNARPVARGNRVYANGGEGITTYGTAAGVAAGGALIENNVVYDNWGANIYVNNQRDATVRNNFVFAHPIDVSDLFFTGSPVWTARHALRLSGIGIGLADEQAGSDATGNYANLAGTRVYNNVVANTQYGIYDYAEGPVASRFHGLKDTVIANNTIILRYPEGPTAAPVGIEIQDNLSPSGINRNANTEIRNNVVYGHGRGALVWSHQGAVGGGLQGIRFGNNLYYSLNTRPFLAGETARALSFADWRGLAREENTLFADPEITRVDAFRASRQAQPVYDWRNALLAPGSVARDRGVAVGRMSSSDFRRISRPQGPAWDLGAFEHAGP